MPDAFKHLQNEIALLRIEVKQLRLSENALFTLFNDHMALCHYLSNVKEVEKLDKKIVAD